MKVCIEGTAWELHANNSAGTTQHAAEKRNIRPQDILRNIFTYRTRVLE